MSIMFLLNKHIAAVSARMMTWEVMTAFDGILTETELQKRFDEEFFDVSHAKQCTNRVFFYHLVSFNASEGRKHRYLVMVADEPLVCYRENFDRCLPQQIVLYAVADKILRGECVDGMSSVDVAGSSCANISVSKNASVAIVNCADFDGNLLLVALWKKSLYILVFVKGRLCHWAEECGYGEDFDVLTAARVAQFKDFLKSDELFASAGSMGESYVRCDEILKVDTLFNVGARDSFWRNLDLDACDSMKPCEKRRWAMCFMALFVLGVSVFIACGNTEIWPLSCMFDNRRIEPDAAPVELSLPALNDLEKMAWADGHRDLIPAKWMLGRELLAEDENNLIVQRRKYRGTCDSLDFKLLGIVGNRVALVQTAVETKMLLVGDSLLSYRVKAIGKNNIVLRCGVKDVYIEVPYGAGKSVVSQVEAR